jgi:CheY-like chemotaxis protein
MPQLDGWGALRELRADPQTRSIPCVAVTAFAAEQDKRRALAAGFDAYISKPYRARDLLELVGRLLDGGRDGRRSGGAEAVGAAHDAPSGRDGNRS